MDGPPMIPDLVRQIVEEGLEHAYSAAVKPADMSLSDWRRCSGAGLQHTFPKPEQPSEEAESHPGEETE